MHSRFLRYSIIAVIFILSYGFIIHKIIHFEELNSFYWWFFITSKESIAMLFVVFSLMFVNWAIEAFKWQKLICGIQDITFFTSLKAVLTGVTVGVFTPNRVGEIGGRIAFLDKGKRTYGAFSSGIGSYAQFIATIIMGLAGFVLFLVLFREKTKINPMFNQIYAFILSIILGLLLWLYFNVKKIIPLLVKVPFFKKRSEQIQYLSNKSGKSLAVILLLSTMRYIVFFVQFYLLLLIFNVDLSFLQGFVSISLTYLFMTLIPTTTLIELGLRGSLALFFIGIFSEMVLGIVLASFIIWIINIAIPAIMGSFFLLKQSSRKPFMV